MKSDGRSTSSQSKSKGLLLNNLSKPGDNSGSAYQQKTIHEHLQELRSYKLAYVPGMPRLVKKSLYELHSKSNLNKQTRKTIEIVLDPEENRETAETQLQEGNELDAFETRTTQQKRENKFNRNFVLVLKTV
jgi:hypothetical protein